jgi:hypothetical protein
MGVRGIPYPGTRRSSAARIRRGRRVTFEQATPGAFTFLIMPRADPDSVGQAVSPGFARLRASVVSAFSEKKSAGMYCIGGTDGFVCQTAIHARIPKTIAAFPSRRRPFVPDLAPLGWSELASRSGRTSPTTAGPERQGIRPDCLVYRRKSRIGRAGRLAIAQARDERRLAGETACPTESGSALSTAGNVETPAAAFHAALFAVLNQAPDAL